MGTGNGRCTWWRGRGAFGGGVKRGCPVFSSSLACTLLFLAACEVRPLFFLIFFCTAVLHSCSCTRPPVSAPGHCWLPHTQTLPHTLPHTVCHHTDTHHGPPQGATAPTRRRQTAQTPQTDNTAGCAEAHPDAACLLEARAPRLPAAWKPLQPSDWAQPPTRQPETKTPGSPRGRHDALPPLSQCSPSRGGGREEKLRLPSGPTGHVQGEQLGNGFPAARADRRDDGAAPSTETCRDRRMNR